MWIVKGKPFSAFQGRIAEVLWGRGEEGNWGMLSHRCGGRPEQGLRDMAVVGRQAWPAVSLALPSPLGQQGVAQFQLGITPPMGWDLGQWVHFSGWDFRLFALTSNCYKNRH